MQNIYIYITGMAWLTFFIYWGVNAGKVKTEVYAQSKTSRRVYLFIVFFCLFSVYIPYFAVGVLNYQVIPAGNVSGIIGVFISIAGVAFAIWARKTLGANWSANVTLKKDHELIQSGPYSIVRHPIYTGFEMLILGPAIVTGQLKGFVALVIIFAAHVWKISMEEEVMNKQFPAQYAEYAKRVKRLIPFVF